MAHIQSTMMIITVPLLTEKDRKEALKSFKDDSLLNDTFNEMYTNESMGGALISMDYDDDFQHFTFYVDKAKYEANELFCSIGIDLTVTALSDTYQAYNFIPPRRQDNGYSNCR